MSRRGRLIGAAALVVVVGAAVANGDGSSDDSHDGRVATGGEPTTATAAVDVSEATSRGAETTSPPSETATAPPSTPVPPATAVPSTTTRVSGALAVRSITDGDTFVLSDGRRVRLAQVDAPETNECFGAESTAALRSMIDGQQVTLRRPPTGPEKDRYGRTLADVEVGGRSVNEMLVSSGAAEWYEEFASEDADLARRLQAAERSARAAGLGLWSACKTTSMAPAPSAQPLVSPPASSAPSPAPAGNCHPAYPDDCIPPAPPDLDCGDIRRAVRVDRTHGDPHGFDANADGWGCESYG
ncbi:MAG TPA: thermonuclease family protein [Acidimicrobiales bacterium]|nr:thermonuclease family protein [Acidimicrobiales bacterium]